MKYYLLLLLQVCVVCLVGQTNPAIEKFIKTPGFENASFGISVKELSGKEVVGYNKGVSLTPASVLKIVTTATSLEILGDNYQFATQLSTDNNNPNRLLVHGYGDPTLGSEFLFDNPQAFLDEWAAQITKQLKNSSPITITLVDDFFGYKGVSSKWIEEDMGNYFAAGSYGISVFDNTYRLYLNSLKTDTCPTILKTVPAMPHIVFSNRLGVNYEGKDNGYINGEPFSNYRKLVGDIPAKRASFVIKGDFPDPAMVLGEALAKRLLRNQIQTDRIETVRSDYYKQMYAANKRWVYDEKPFYRHVSPPLKDIIRVVNEKSNNHYSEHLMRTIGRQTNTDIYSDALMEGINRTAAFWASKGLNTDGMHIYDGCGLAPSNSINPQLLCDILVYMQTKSRYKQVFLSSLPKAGSEGTVRNFLKGTRLENKVLVKSGSIANVQCFAGYYIDGDKKYAFSVMVNNYNSPRKDVVRAIESVLLSLFR